MARTYYIFTSGRLHRKGNTLYLERSEEVATAGDQEPAPESEMIGQSVHAENDAEALSEAMTLKEDETSELSEATADSMAEPASAEASAAQAPERPRAIPVEDVEQLFLFGEVALNTKLLNFLAQKGIPLHVFNYYGFYSGTYYPRESNVSGYLLIRQVEHYLRESDRVELAKEIVRGAVHNLRRNVLYYRNRGKSVDAALDVMEREAQQIERADSVAALMGAEGRVREAYYRAFNEILDLETPFLRRVKRPPDNLVNALLSFGNSLLYATVLAQIYRTPLNPTISYLHEPGTRRFSLALDLAEIFKPLIVDKMIFKLINKQMVGDEDLMEEVGFAYLKERARKIVVQEFEQRLQATVKHRRMGRNVSYRGFIRLECYKLVRHLIGSERYHALRAWW